MTTYVEDGWKRFEELVIPPAASDVQRREMRKAFYAGGSWLFAILTQSVSADEEVTEQDLRLMHDVANELQEFADSLVDPVTRALDNAPIDDEPVTHEDRAEIEQARREFDAGQTVSMNELRRELDLDD